MVAAEAAVRVFKTAGSHQFFQFPRWAAGLEDGLFPRVETVAAVVAQAQTTRTPDQANRGRATMGP